MKIRLIAACLASAATVAVAGPPAPQPPGGLYLGA
ncbi:MAG: hypothetical protein QOK41_1844, partial [Sphingomonadales bacterium]|nr:hypothetical protein [Sphingomonadales bacterium]